MAVGAVTSTAMTVTATAPIDRMPENQIGRSRAHLLPPMGEAFPRAGRDYGFELWPLPDELPLPDCEVLVVLAAEDEDDEGVEGCSLAVCPPDVWPFAVRFDDFACFVSVVCGLVCACVFLL